MQTLIKRCEPVSALAPTLHLVLCRDVLLHKALGLDQWRRKECGESVLHYPGEQSVMDG